MQLTADVKRKAAQLDAADNQITLLKNENATLKAAKVELEQVQRGGSTGRQPVLSAVALPCAQRRWKVRCCLVSRLNASGC